MSVPAGPSMQQAFADAKVEHSEQSEQAVASEASTAATAPTQPAQHIEKAASAPSETAESTDLISDADWTALQDAFKGDPSKQRAELNRVFTQKTQSLSAERKRLERFARHADLIDAYDADPTGTIQQLADQHGIGRVQPPEKPAQPANPQDQTLADVKAALGPDLDFLAEPIAKVVEKLVAPHVSKAIQPLQEQTNTILSQAAEGHVENVLKSFTEKHPDWKTHEPAMMKLGLQPAPGMSEGDYLESLYKLATYDSQIDKARAEAVTKLSKAAEAAEKEHQTVPGKQVSLTAPKGASMRDAHAAAKRGEVWA